MRVRDGIAGTVTLPCESLQQQGKRVAVRTDNEPYRIEVSSDVEPEYAERVTANTPGLDVDVGTVFRCGPEGGRRLDEHSALHWGWPYLVVWPQQLLVQWPESVWREALEDSAGYHAAWIQLPTDANQPTEQWAADYLARRIEHPPMTLSVVTPVTSTADDDAVIVGLGEEVVLGIIREPGAAPPDALALTYSSGVTRRLTFQSTDTVTLVTLGRLPAGRVRVSVEGADDDATLLLDVRPRANEGNLPAAGIEAQPAALNGGTEAHTVTAPLYSQAAARLLERVQAESAVIAGVILPPRVSCLLRVRGPGESEWEQSEYADSGVAVSPLSAGSTGGLADLTERLTLSLRSGADVQIDAGAFGRINLLPRRQASAPGIRSVVALRPELRARIQWLLSVADGTFATKARDQVPASPRLAEVLGSAAPLANGDDLELLRRLACQQSWPRLLEPHVRLLVKSLRAYVQEAATERDAR